MSDRFSDEYKSLPRQVLNQKLRGLYELVPDMSQLRPKSLGFRLNMSNEEYKRWRTNPQTDQLRAEIQDRQDSWEKSDTVKKLNGRYEGLVSQAVVTPAFKEYHVMEYRGFLRKGMVKEPITIIGGDWERLTKRFQWDNPETGGIFDAASSQELDQFAYQIVAGSVIKWAEERRRIIGEPSVRGAWEKKLESLRKRQEGMSEEDAFDAKYDLKKLEKLMGPWVEEMAQEEDLVRRWRTEHLELFGQEP